MTHQLRRTCGGGFLAVALVISQAALYADDSLSTARELYASASYEDALTRFFTFTDEVGITHAEQVSPGAVEAFVATLRHRDGRSVATANHRRYALVTFFRLLQVPHRVQRERRRN